MATSRRPHLSTLSQINPTILEEYATNDHIISNKHPDPNIPLIIHNYSDRTAFREFWDPITIACRTLITETKTGRVVARGFPKFFGYHEKQAYRPTGRERQVVIEEKLDGSIALLFWYEGRWIWTSKGSFDSLHSAFAQQVMAERYADTFSRLSKETTYVFEIIHPDNVIGVRYGDRKELVLLAIFHRDGRETRLDAPGGAWETLPFGKPNVFALQTRHWGGLRELPLINFEGFVVRFHRSDSDDRPRRIKVKLRRYMQLIKTRRNISGPEDIRRYYTACRATLPTFEAEVVGTKMRAFKEDYFKIAQSMADDLEGREWVASVETTWNRIDSQFAHIGRRWQGLLRDVRQDGYGSREQGRREEFARMVYGKHMAKEYKEALCAWYDRKNDMVMGHLCKLAR